MILTHSYSVRVPLLLPFLQRAPPCSLEIIVPFKGRDILSAEGIINKRVSRAQVTLKRQANRMVTAELSGLNPSLINDTKLEKGRAVEVKAGDVVKLLPDFGHFTLVKTEPKPESVDTEEDEPLAAAGPKRRLLDEDDAAPPKRSRSIKEDEPPVVLARQPSLASMERVAHLLELTAFLWLIVGSVEQSADPRGA